MSDGLPTDEQLRRIERGVRQRIDRRRRVAQRVAQASVAVVLIAGGFALLRPVVGTSGSSSAGGSMAQPASGTALVPVTCHGSRVRTAEADESGLPASALAACAAKDARLGPQALDGDPENAPSPASPSPTAASSAAPSRAAVLCRTTDGDLHVFADTTCRAHGMTPYPG